MGGFDVYVSIDGGPLQIWLKGTTVTSAIYTAKGSQQLAFYCVAYDYAGNKEDPQASPQSSTQVMIAPGGINGDGLVNLSDVVLGLKTLVLMDSDKVQVIEDADSDCKVGLDVIIFIMQKTSGLR